MCVLILLIWRVFIPFMSSIPSASYTCSASSYSGLLEPWWEEFDGDIPFRAKYSKVPHSLCIVWLWVSVFLLICQQEEISVIMTVLCKALFYECSRVSLGVILLLHSLSNTTVFVFTQHPRLSSLRFLVTQAALIPSC